MKSCNPNLTLTKSANRPKTMILNFKYKVFSAPLHVILV